ncbi:MAG: hypothetical protein ACO3GT_03670 [Candidatus Nanopelagicales bacterium]|jgi:hypothetical protein
MTKLWVVLISAVVGVFVSLIAGFAHADRIVILGVSIPYGLVLSLTICFLTVLWLNRQFQTRLAGTVFTVSWVLVTLRMAIESGNGDLVFTVTWYSTSYIIAGAILLSMAAVLPAMRLPDRGQHSLPESQA